MKTGSQLIADERQRQIDTEGYDPAHDDEHKQHELARAAVCYAMPPGQRNLSQLDNRRGERVPLRWPWDGVWWKPTPNDRVRELVKAGALIAAEIDRLQRMS